VTFRLREAAGFLAQGSSITLPGTATGAPNAGPVAGHEGTSLVIPSRVTVDFADRAVNVFDLEGDFRPGWPVFVFPHPSSQGGLKQPLVADMDGQAGAEIVVTSEFGSLYFFHGNGTYTPVDLVINRPLTTAAGLRDPQGRMLAVAADKAGLLRAWSDGAQLEAQVDLGHSDPLDPAVGLLTAGTGESVVVAFRDGWVTALDADLSPRPGWPVDLGTPATLPPVLVDLDGDRFHEIVVPSLDDATGRLTLRVLDGTGQPDVGDGGTLPSPGGGPWLGVAPAMVAGGYYTDDLRVVVAGLADSGLAGDQARWRLGCGSLRSDGTTGVSVLAGFEVRATTAEGELQVDRLVLPTPVTWNFTGGGGADVGLLMGVRWKELLYGLTSIPGSATAWYREGSAADPLAARLPVRSGGKNDPGPGHLGAVIVDAGDVLLRVQSVDQNVTIIPILTGRSSTPFWTAARADARNTGAMPPAPLVSPAPPPGVPAAGLTVYPNPGSGRFHFRLDGWAGRGNLTLEVYDLRGRRLRTIGGGTGAGELLWDGTDGRGRPVGAGTYLAVVRGAGAEPLVRRLVLTR